MWVRGVFSTALYIIFLRPASSSYAWIAGYEPRSQVADHAAIDLDQQEIEKWLTLRMFEPAEGIYKKGGHSQTIARVNLVDAEPPLQPFPAGTTVYGWTDSGQAVKGKLVEEVTWGRSEKNVQMLIEYDPVKEFSNQLNCQVGALVLTDSAKREGCFASEGLITVLHYSRNSPAYQFNYTYEVEENNFNGRTIQYFSTRAYGEMWNCTNCPYDTFFKYVKYYGVTDYGDQWVTAAFDGTSTNFDNGNIDFRDESRKNRAESIKICTKFLNIYMYSIRMMEYALDQCEMPCKKSKEVLYDESQRGQCDDTPVKAWDQSVAFYAGSLEGESGMGSGLLLFDLADKMCKLFHACGEDASLRYGSSYVNNVVIEAFMTGQRHILKRECGEARLSKEKIVKVMAVPLVQATLLNAYNREYHPSQVPETASFDAIQGVSYAATVLPLVYDCNREDAATIHRTMRLEKDDIDQIDFLALKRAFERNFLCMGITCTAVGGIMEDNRYAPNASPCIDIPERDSFDLGLEIALVGGFFVLIAVYMLYRRSRTEIDHSFREHPPNEVLQASRRLE